MITVIMAIKYGSFAFGYALPDVAVVSSALGQGGRIMEIIDTVEPEDDETAQKPYVEGKIRVENVHFNYPSRPDVPILKGLSFECQPGETVALIVLDDIPLEDFNVNHLRKIVGVVSQEPVLFNNTILENLRFGNANASDREVHVALKKANALGFIAEFPDASRGRTTIVIAHRLSTIKNADKILVISNGEVAVKPGNTTNSKKRGHYFDLVNAQVFADAELHKDQPAYTS
ncbi:unnamed protein product, partial [Mesorhabditis belari]|uniref:Uncharacterized protein n=1 Tax=Mesorhabditis belari TaxID=2138241 RepID=A0AAF3F8U3_9BILA